MNMYKWSAPPTSPLSVTYKGSIGEWKISRGFLYLLMILSDGYFNIKCTGADEYQLENIKSRLILDGVPTCREYTWKFYTDKKSQSGKYISDTIEDDLEINFINNILNPSRMHSNSKGVDKDFLYEILDNSEIYNSGYGYLIKYPYSKSGVEYYYINPNGLLFKGEVTFDFDMDPKLLSYLDVTSYERK